MDSFGNAGSSHDMAWPDDLAHRDTDHTWLWALTPAHGRVFEDREFVEAIRLRLGVGGPPDTATCGLWCNAVLEPLGAHPACCATGEATRGHNRVRNIVHQFSLIADASAEREPLGLVLELPMLHPADILISAALDGCTAALDVGITASGASETDADPAETMHNKKACPSRQLWRRRMSPLYGHPAGDPARRPRRPCSASLAKWRGAAGTGVPRPCIGRCAGPSAQSSPTG